MKTKELFIISEKNYGSNYKEHLFEQYKLYVESIEKTSDRRQSANSHFLTINTALISIIGLSTQIKFFQEEKLVYLLLSLVGIIISILFWFLIRSYKQLNTGKFKVLHQIEEKLPISLYDYEWEILGEGKNKRIYLPFSHIELYIPFIFGLIYFGLGIFFYNNL